MKEVRIWGGVKRALERGKFMEREEYRQRLEQLKGKIRGKWKRI